MKYYRAQDAFVGESPDGTHYSVAKGDVLPEGNRIVQHDLKHGGKNFKALEDGETAKPRSRARVKA